MPVVNINLDIPSDLKSKVEKKIKNKKISIEEYLQELIENDFSSIISFQNDITFNTTYNTLLYKDEEIELRKLEKKFFVYLLENQNKICTIEEIKENVWDGKNMSIYTLRNVVNKIRSKTYYDIIKNKSNHGYMISIM